MCIRDRPRTVIPVPNDNNVTTNIFPSASHLAPPDISDSINNIPAKDEPITPLISLETLLKRLIDPNNFTSKKKERVTKGDLNHELGKILSQAEEPSSSLSQNNNTSFDYSSFLPEPQVLKRQKDHSRNHASQTIEPKPIKRNDVSFKDPKSLSFTKPNNKKSSMKQKKSIYSSSDDSILFPSETSMVKCLADVVRDIEIETNAQLLMLKKQVDDDLDDVISSLNDYKCA
jgi:hypothetical protein